MPRKNIDRLQNAVGLLTSMNRPWDRAEDANTSEEVQGGAGGPQLRPVFSVMMAALAMSLASIKSLFPDAWL